MIKYSSSSDSSFPCPLALSKYPDQNESAEYTDREYHANKRVSELRGIQRLVSVQIKHLKDLANAPEHLRAAIITSLDLWVLLWRSNGCLVARELIEVLLDEGADEGLHALMRAHR